MTLFRKHQEADALAFAQAGGQALHVLGLTPARLYDANLGRLVNTARELGPRDVRVFRTCSARQHVVIEGWPLVKACMQSRDVTGADLIDLIPIRDVRHGMEVAS